MSRQKNKNCNLDTRRCRFCFISKLFRERHVHYCFNFGNSFWAGLVSLDKFNFGFQRSKMSLFCRQNIKRSTDVFEGFISLESTNFFWQNIIFYIVQNYINHILYIFNHILNFKYYNFSFRHLLWRKQYLSFIQKEKKMQKSRFRILLIKKCRIKVRKK